MPRTPIRQEGAMTADDYTAAITSLFNADHLKAARMLGISRACSYYYMRGERPVSKGAFQALCYIRALGVDAAELALSIRPQWRSGTGSTETHAPHTASARRAGRDGPHSSGDREADPSHR